MTLFPILSLKLAYVEFPLNRLDYISFIFHMYENGAEPMM